MSKAARLSTRQRRWAMVALAAIAVPLDVEATRLIAGYHDPTTDIVMTLVLGWTYLVAGFVAWQRRPASSLGLLMIWASFATILPTYAYDSHFVNHVADALSGIGIAASAHVILAYPDGRLHGRRERTAVELAYVLVIGTGWLTLGPPVPTPFMRLRFFAATAITAAVAALALGRFVRASRPARRELVPVLVGVGSFAMFATVFALWAVFPGTAEVVRAGGSFTRVLNDRAAAGWNRAVLIIAILVPIAYLIGVLRLRLATAGVADLVAELRTDMPPEELRGRLSRILGDPSLALVFPAAGSGYVDAAGEPVSLSALPHGRDTTVVERDGIEMAILVHDDAVDRDLVRAAASAVQLALENERLRAEVRAQLREVRESRQRLVAAGDAERRRVERNIHDGAQQRLLTLGLALRRAERHVKDDRDDAARLLKEAAEELEAALQDLRSLVQGIHPPLLTDEGLGPALRALADRCPIPTEFVGSLDERPSPELESTVYFVASEALSNVVKHSWATSVLVTLAQDGGRLRLEVRDDGIGGADTSGGTGLAGLRDRVDAVDGDLQIDSPSGGGTRLTASVPLR